MNEVRRVAVITGGAGSIGFECARRLGGDGAAIALFDVDEDRVAAAVKLLEAEGISACGFRADVTNEQDLRQAVGSVESRIGATSMLVNAAGVLRQTPLLEISVAEWNHVMDVSVKGTFLCTKACLPSMIEQGWGRVVNLSSTAGKNVSTLGGAHYTAAKAAVLGLTRAVANEVARSGICVNAVCPGLIETDMARSICDPDELREIAAAFPIPRLGRPDEVASLVNFLCSEAAAYITGAAIDINGGDLMI